MKKLIIAALGVALAGIGINSYATDNTANLNVTAEIQESCVLTTDAVAFGVYNGISAHASTALDGTGTVHTTCTTGATGVIKLGQGANADTSSSDITPLRQMIGAGGTPDSLAYFLYSDAGRTTVWGNTKATGKAFATGDGTVHDLTVYGRVTAGQNKKVDTYSDVVVVTIDFS